MCQLWWKTWCERLSQEEERFLLGNGEVKPCSEIDRLRILRMNPRRCNDWRWRQVLRAVDIVETLAIRHVKLKRVRIFREVGGRLTRCWTWPRAAYKPWLSGALGQWRRSHVIGYGFQLALSTLIHVRYWKCWIKRPCKHGVKLCTGRCTCVQSWLHASSWRMWIEHQGGGWVRRQCDWFCAGSWISLKPPTAATGGWSEILRHG